MIDNDINTTEVHEITSGGSDASAFLFNSCFNLSGLCIQFSGAFITDNKVEAIIGPVDLVRKLAVSQVCGATGDFTFVPLVDPQDGKNVLSDTLFVKVTGVKGNSATAVVNEIWPVSPSDES